MPLAQQIAVEPEVLPRQRSLTRDFLGDTFANQVQPLNGAANGPVDPSFGDVVSVRRSRSKIVMAVAAVAAVAGAAAYYLLFLG